MRFATRRGRRGTVERPYSALNLRLVLAGFGLVSCLLLAWLSARADLWVLAVALAVLAVAAAVDLVVIQRRRRARRRRDGDEDRSLFE